MFAAAQLQDWARESSIAGRRRQRRRARQRSWCDGQGGEQVASNETGDAWALRCFALCDQLQDGLSPCAQSIVPGGGMGAAECLVDGGGRRRVCAVIEGAQIVFADVLQRSRKGDNRRLSVCARWRRGQQ